MAGKTHPIQPLEVDDQGVWRFKRNAIVCYLLEHGGIDMNHLARQDFSDDDRMQFAQLIGYSLGGFSELHYTSDDVYGAAVRMAEADVTEEAARLAYTTDLLQSLRTDLREPMAELFGVHPDDLK